MSLFKKMTTFSIIGITFIFLLSVVWNISRNSSLLEGDNWLEAHELRSMNNDRSLPQLNHYTLNDLFKYKDQSSLIGLYTTNTNYSSTISSSTYSLYFEVQNSGDYYIYKDRSSSANRFRLVKTTLEPAPSMSISDYINKDSSSINEHVYSANKGEYIGIYFWNSSNDISMENMLSTIKIYYLPDGYSENDLHEYYDLYQYNKGNEAKLPYLANLTLNEVFGDGNLFDINNYQQNSSFPQRSVLNGEIKHEVVSPNPSANFIGVHSSVLFNNADRLYHNYEVKSYEEDDRVRHYTRAYYGPYYSLNVGEWNHITNKNYFTSDTADDRIVINNSVNGSKTAGEFVYFRNVYIINITSLGIDNNIPLETLDSYFELYKLNLENPQDQIYINYHDYNYIEQGSKTINTFLTYWNHITSTFDTAKWLTDLIIGDSLNTYDYYEYEELYLLWNDNTYYLDPLTQLTYNMILYEKGLYYLLLMDQSSGTHEEQYRTVLDYEDLDHYNSQYFWIDKE